MPMPMRRPRDRALRPSTESLEARKLLSRMVVGTDVDGDAWTLQLDGPGDLRVVKQAGADGLPAPLESPTLIDRIEIAGADPQKTRVTGRVNKGTEGDGRVFFEELDVLGGRSLSLPGNVGIQTIDIPDFWLGDTSPETPNESGMPTGRIAIPGGIVTLRFGGVDTTAFFGTSESQRVDQNNTADDFTISMGLPQTTGTSIVVNKIVTSAQAGQPTPGSTTPPPPVQDSVTFVVAGRLNLFQADQIEGSLAFPSTGFQGGGGTLVVSAPDETGTVPGQIGNVRVGGDATNFAVQTSTKVSNYYIGGEANNVFLLAPEGSRNIFFGKGMDTAVIQTHNIENLQANRGAVNSRVITNRSIGRAVFGGDVVDTQVLSGYEQDLAGEFQNQSPPTLPPRAQVGGGMTALVAGDVVDSVFAASVQPLDNVFGTPFDLKIPGGHIDGKVEGTINNTTATPLSPDTAFYAQVVSQVNGPVVPPAIPEAPFPGTVYHRGQASLTTPLSRSLGLQQSSPIPSRQRPGRFGSAVPRGPRPRIGP